MPLYTKNDRTRLSERPGIQATEPYRTAFRRDYARLLHSPAFRRLQGKKQLFPGVESDFFRNRLTHSLEVAQVAKSIAIRLNATESLFQKSVNKIDLDLVEFAALAHDLGHPPFGHNGEEALDECMQDAGGFEGNAQTLRILSRLEKRAALAENHDGPQPVVDGIDVRLGLDITYRALASILKYDQEIPRQKTDRDPEHSGAVKGYYYTEREIVRAIKRHVGGHEDDPLRTVECCIMDIADDIAYSTYDLEDAFKAGFLTPTGILATPSHVAQKICLTIQKRVKKYYSDCVEKDYEFRLEHFYTILLNKFRDILQFGEEADLNMETTLSQSEQLPALANFIADVTDLSNKFSSNGYYRTKFTSELVTSALSGVELLPQDNLANATVRLNFRTFLEVEVFKNLTYETLIMSPMLKVAEARGKEIVKEIFRVLNNRDEKGYLLMPDDHRRIYQELHEPDERARVVCDFIAGMTDRYAIQFYNRLFGTVGESIYSPV